MTSPYKVSKTCHLETPLPTEILRSTPVPTTYMPKTFAEAALLASQKTQGRCPLSAAAVQPQSQLQGIELLPIQLEHHFDSSSSGTSKGSRSSCSSLENVIAPLSAAEEGEMSVQLLSLALSSPGSLCNASFRTDSES